MKLKEMFNKAAAYNEVSEAIGITRQKVDVYFSDAGIFGNHFRDYDSFRTYVKREYLDSVSKQILNSEEWTIDGNTVSIEWKDCCGIVNTCLFTAEIAAIW